MNTTTHNGTVIKTGYTASKEHSNNVKSYLSNFFFCLLVKEAKNDASASSSSSSPSDATICCEKRNRK